VGGVDQDDELVADIKKARILKAEADEELTK
jgi:hypothetical protein